jgi:hypothetical protein
MNDLAIVGRDGPGDRAHVHRGTEVNLGAISDGKTVPLNFVARRV